MTQPDLDQAPVAPPGSLGGVPVVDLRDLAARDAVGQACRDWGFFQVVGHGVPQAETEAILDLTRRYFALPAETKRRDMRTIDNPWGYYDRELTKEQRDRKQVFDIGPDATGGARGDDPFEGTTHWPDEPPGFEAVLRRWYGDMSDLAGRIMGLVSASLTGDADRLRASFEPGHSSHLRLNFYPVADPLGDEASGEADLGVHHHTDAGGLTVLLQDGVSGLQVYRDGRWHSVEPVPGAFTINIGDMVQVWSNDLYHAPPHRVLAMDSSDRYSLPFFYNPSYDAVIEPLVGPPRYRPLSWAEFRRRRAEGDYSSYGTEVQISEWRIAE
jgi:isopenicillin N synthase-like dioxygenase